MVLLRRRAAHARLPLWFWIVALTVECTLPSVSIISLWKSGALPAGQAIVAPSILFYTVFIALSALHLREGLPIAAGLICALEHGAIIVMASDSSAGNMLPLASLITYPVALVFVGVASAFVAMRFASICALPCMNPNSANVPSRSWPRPVASSKV